MTVESEDRSASDQHLRKAISLRHAVALYVSSVLGSGILVLPSLAAKIAGPSSLIAWVFLAVASYPFAYTFASLSSRMPKSGGVYAFAKEAFGLHAATVTSWLFGLWYIAGSPAVMLIAASYLAYAFPMSRADIYLVAALVIMCAFRVNYRGITFSNKVQLAVVVAIVAMPVAAVATSVGSVKPANFSPLFPNGLLSVGTAAALIFWSFLGYENVSNVAEEFSNPKRDFLRSVVLSVVLVDVLYVSVAVVTVGTKAYDAGGGVAPFAAIFSRLLGRYGAAGTAALAFFIIFGAANAYTTGISRVIFAAAKDAAFPPALAHLNSRTMVPDLCLMFLSGFSMVMLGVFYVFNADLQTALLIPSGAAIIVYIIGSVAGIRLLKNTGGGKASRGWLSQYRSPHFRSWELLLCLQRSWRWSPSFTASGLAGEMLWHGEVKYLSDSELRASIKFRESG